MDGGDEGGLFANFAIERPSPTAAPEFNFPQNAAFPPYHEYADNDRISDPRVTPDSENMTVPNTGVRDKRKEKADEKTDDDIGCDAGDTHRRHAGSARKSPGSPSRPPRT